jgi:guanylate kinase
VKAGRRGFPFVVAAPSGTGKTSVCRCVVKKDPLVEFSVSHTTRPRRDGEAEGIDYHFVTHERFQEMVREDAFLEWAEYDGNHYGTSWASIEHPLGLGRDVLLEIEVQGAAQVRERRGDARFIFLLPPSMGVLRDRLRARGTDTPERIERRLALAAREMEEIRHFDYAVVNDDLARCVAEVCRILRGERGGGAAYLRRRLDPQAALARLLRG